MLSRQVADGAGGDSLSSPDFCSLPSCHDMALRSVPEWCATPGRSPGLPMGAALEEAADERTLRT
ncbi:hypothetical protein I41_02220 [Lacipirellula limnantheis]|uniref:Uncharacterized protein n=1 Tax=Lacipirellula limnantheis TaxID=2528024 RepID=A0A517TRR7_9BACT|nr:hypothetical protein I41_02220 [Lacipirellula limnantheis]